MFHFTYSKIKQKKHLTQGDILKKTPEIIKIINEVHPHYLKDDYKYFMIITQSCDLYKREDGYCSTPYITLAAIRPLETLLEKKQKDYQYSKIEQIAGQINEKNQGKLREFLERLLNNNEPEYFYLHEQVDCGLDGRLVTFLKLSIAIKADLHYKTCLKAKILEISDNFKAKLGWKTGNIYSRVGTKDWEKEKMNEQIDIIKRRFKLVKNDILEYLKKAI